jgi:hypothetical protein
MASRKPARSTTAAAKPRATTASAPSATPTTTRATSPPAPSEASPPTTPTTTSIGLPAPMTAQTPPPTPTTTSATAPPSPTTPAHTPTATTTPTNSKPSPTRTAPPPTPTTTTATKPSQALGHTPSISPARSPRGRMGQRLRAIRMTATATGSARQLGPRSPTTSGTPVPRLQDSRSSETALEPLSVRTRTGMAGSRLSSPARLATTAPTCSGPSANSATDLAIPSASSAAVHSGRTSLQLGSTQASLTTHSTSPGSTPTASLAWSTSTRANTTQRSASLLRLIP